jgi:PAS domain S-box-containing protein
MLLIFSMPEGRLLDVNPAWERTFGLSRAEALGHTPDQLGLIADGARYVPWMRSLKLGDAGALTDPVLVRGRRQDSIYCVYSWSTVELNERLCVLVVAQDITERVRAEEELRRSRETMVSQDRLSAVGELASGIAHDLNNSLLRQLLPHSFHVAPSRFAKLHYAHKVSVAQGVWPFSTVAQRFNGARTLACRFGLPACYSLAKILKSAS